MLVKHWLHDAEEERSISQIIQDEVDTSPDYYSGEIEALRSKIMALTKIVGAMSELLSPEQQRALATALGRKPV